MENVFRVFFFNPPKIDRSEHTVMLKDWPLKPFLKRHFEGGQTSHKYTNTHCVLYGRKILRLLPRYHFQIVFGHLKIPFKVPF